MPETRAEALKRVRTGQHVVTGPGGESYIAPATRLTGSLLQKQEHMYWALRHKGLSSEYASRIVNSRMPHVKDFSPYNKIQELLKRAKDWNMQFINHFPDPDAYTRLARERANLVQEIRHFYTEAKPFISRESGVRFIAKVNTLLKTDENIYREYKTMPIHDAYQQNPTYQYMGFFKNPYTQGDDQMPPPPKSRLTGKRLRQNRHVFYSMIERGHSPKVASMGANAVSHR